MMEKVLGRILYGKGVSLVFHPIAVVVHTVEFVLRRQHDGNSAIKPFGEGLGVEKHTSRGKTFGVLPLRKKLKKPLDAYLLLILLPQSELKSASFAVVEYCIVDQTPDLGLHATNAKSSAGGQLG